MKVEMLMNGAKKIVLIPEDDLEKAFLESFSKSPTVETTLIEKQMPLLDIVVHNGLIIKTKVKQSEEGTSSNSSH